MTQKTRRTFCVSPCSMSYDAFIQVFCARGDLGAAVLPPWRAAAFSRCASARHGRGLWVRVPLSHAAISFNAFAFENICQQYPTFRAAGFTPPAGLTPQANCGCPPGSVESDPITALVVKGAVGCVPPQLAVKNGLFRAGRVTVKFLSVMCMSTLTPKNAHFLASAKNSCFLDSCGNSPRPSPLWEASGKISLCADKQNS